MSDWLTRQDKEAIRTALRLHQPIGKKLFPLLEDIIARNRAEAHRHGANSRMDERFVPGPKRIDGVIGA